MAEDTIRGQRPMTVIWGEQDPVAVVAMADRIKRSKPELNEATWRELEAAGVSLT